MSATADRLVGMARRLLRLDFLRFLLAGALNTAFGYVVYLLVLAFGVDPSLALVATTAIGALFNYMTTGRFVFRQQNLGKPVPFLAAYTAIYVVNLLALRALMGVGVAPQWAQGMLVPPIAVASFLIFKYLVFNDRRVGSPPGINR